MPLDSIYANVGLKEKGINIKKNRPQPQKKRVKSVFFGQTANNWV